MTATNLSHILTHIEASAPCSLFSVAVWSDEQLNVTLVSFNRIIDTLIAADVISISCDNSGVVVDLI